MITNVKYLNLNYFVIFISDSQLTKILHSITDMTILSNLHHNASTENK